MQNAEFCTLAARVQRLACRATSSSAELLVHLYVHILKTTLGFPLLDI